MAEVSKSKFINKQSESKIFKQNKTIFDKNLYESSHTNQLYFRGFMNDNSQFSRSVLKGASKEDG